MTDFTRKPASPHTAGANEAVRAAMSADVHDFELAGRRRLAALAGPVVHPRFGHRVWDMAEYAFLDAERAPATVNPSLWRQARLNAIAGLFEVVPGVYQVRGIDLSNVTFIEGRDGWIVIDPLSSSETAAAALELLQQHRPARPITAVIYTHSHVDHFGGVRGVIDQADVDSGKVRVIAPQGFLHAAISENVIAGNVMARRATYMYGRLLPSAPDGHVDCGLGKAIPLLGTFGLIAPTEEVAATGTELDVDGVRIVFQLTPDTEAPAEMNFFFPDKRLLCMAENCSATLHNVYTPRGAPIRDALGWSKYIDEAIELFAADTDAEFASHHWPHWGRDEVRRHLCTQRDAYRYLHDQTMRRANRGETPREIAEDFAMPPTLAGQYTLRGYYGTVSHNVKAVYQRYLGWFDANPANLHPLPPVEAGARYVECMGGADEVLRKARASFDAGDYRWTAELLNHLVFADPTRAEARALQADTLEQLGYQAESGPWRDFYLTGAQELRQGAPMLPPMLGANLEMLRAMTTGMLLDLLGVRLDGPRAAAAVAADGPIALNLVVSGEPWFVELSNGALHAIAGRHDERADVTVTLDRGALAEIASGVQPGALHAVDITGHRETFDRLLALLDSFTMGFPIVEP
jgi:alkyl sulfatase BDS1-like metallo-beta-lactamase superfamily hydrolase